MVTLIVVLGVALTVALLYMLFRIGNLVSLMGRKQEDDMSTNAVHGYLFMAFCIIGLGWFAWYSYTYFDDYNLPVASVHGVLTDSLFWITMAVTLAAFIPISIFMFWFTLRYRYRKGERALFYPHNNKLEVFWTVVPAIVLAVLIFRGLFIWGDVTDEASEDAEVIELVGQQFAWTARYPGADHQLGEVDYRLIDAVNEFGLDLTDPHAYDDFKALELHLPKGRETLLQIRAKDVLHSVFLPHFRVKMDAVPGMLTSFKFTPTKSTQDMREETGNEDFTYELACAEVCGKGHFTMRLVVVVDEPEEYEKWKAEQAPWLRQNPEYMDRIPEKLRRTAQVNAGLPQVEPLSPSITEAGLSSID